MKVEVNKCDQCGAIIDGNDADYQEHLETHAKLTLLEGAFPTIKDEHCEFANGGWSIQRDAEWLSRYKERIEALVGPLGYEPWSYGWFRCLDDGNSPYYRVACRAMNVCPACFREWGQPFYANNCQHKDKVAP